MIISHRHRFIFVQVPQTGCTAIGSYLLDNVDCESVISKHTTIETAYHQLDHDVRSYAVVASVRNPIDQVMSSFYKLKSDHHGELEAAADDGGASIKANRMERLEWAADPAHGFDDYVLTFLRKPYAPIWLGSMRRADQLLRFESLADDFDRARAALGCPDGPPLAYANRTSRPRDDLQIDAVSGPARAQLLRMCGPFMREWGYSEPDGWPAPDAHPATSLAYWAIPRLKVARKDIRRRTRRFR